MELLEILSLTASVKMGGTTKLLAKFPSMEESNLLESPRFGVADFLLFSIPGLHISSEGGVVLVTLAPMEILVPVMLLEYGVEVLLIPL